MFEPLQDGRGESHYSASGEADRPIAARDKASYNSPVTAGSFVLKKMCSPEVVVTCTNGGYPRSRLLIPGDSRPPIPVILGHLC